MAVVGRQIGAPLAVLGSKADFEGAAFGAYLADDVGHPRIAQRSTRYPGSRVPSAVQMSSPAVLICSTCSWTSRTSDVENPVPGSVNTISVGVADTGEGNGAVGDDGAVGADGVGDTGLAPSQPVSPIANTKARNPDCVLFVMNFSPYLGSGKRPPKLERRHIGGRD